MAEYLDMINVLLFSFVYADPLIVRILRIRANLILFLLFSAMLPSAGGESKIYRPVPHVNINHPDCYWLRKNRIRESSRSRKGFGTFTSLNRKSFIYLEMLSKPQQLTPYFAYSWK